MNLKNCLLCGYFISIYIINRTLHGRLGIRFLSSRAESISQSFAALSLERYFQHSKITLPSPRCNILWAHFATCLSDSKIGTECTLILTCNWNDIPNWNNWNECLNPFHVEYWSDKHKKGCLDIIQDSRDFSKYYFEQSHKLERRQSERYKLLKTGLSLNCKM